MLFSLFLSLCGWMPGAAQSGGDFANNPQAKKLPTGTLLVKGAWSSASDALTPMPENGRLTNDTYRNEYFGLTYTLPPDWTEKYNGPPPSDSGYYVLGQFRPANTFKGNRGGILITAQDLFFALSPAENALQLMNYGKDHLSADYQVEQWPSLVRIADHSFVRFDYGSPVADLHWHVLATQIRCHMVQFVFTGRDTQLLESLVESLNKMILPDEAGPISGTGGQDVPVCIKDYARDQNVIERVDPLFSERRFNAVPVRIIINKEGKVKHIHFLSAFPDQAKAVTEALFQWRFKPYLREGSPVEVETGMLFGRAPRAKTPTPTNAATE